MTTLRNTPPSLELADYGGLAHRRRHLIVAGALLGLLLGIISLMLAPRTYTASASVLVKPTGVHDPTPLEQGISPAEVNLDTEAQLVTSFVVANAVRELMRVPITTEELIDNARVAVPPNSAVMTISYTGPTPERARLGAHTFAQSYLEHRREEANGSVTSQVTTLRDRARKLTADITDLNGRIATLQQGTSAHTRAQARLDLLTRQISTVDSRISALTTTPVTAGTIISDAKTPSEPSAPSGTLHLTSGLMGGLLLGVLAAALRDRADRKIRRADDVERMTGASVLLRVPAKRGEKVGLAAPRTQLAQAFHELCHSVTTTLGHGHHVVLVTGISPGQGGSIVATNLAAALVRTGSDTVLVSADPLCSESSRLLGLRGSPGLTDVVARGEHAADVEQRSEDLPRLRVVVPGDDGDLLAERLQTHAMERFVGELRQTAVYVIVEAPATSTSADAQALADVADAAVVVVEIGATEHEQAREGVRRLDGMGAPVLGAVTVPALSGERRAASGDGRERRSEVDDRSSLLAGRDGRGD